MNIPSYIIFPKIWSRLCIVALLCGGACTAALGEVVNDEEVPLDPDPARAARMVWWNQARFGMFIHWGLYSELAGHWNGKSANTVGEWIMDWFQIPRDEYAEIAKRFNPTEFDAAKWVGVAKDAGMKYLVITAKHHDGFCMFSTAQTRYNIVDATPFHRDPMKELSAECKKQGIHFGVYYSILDWHDPSQYGSDKPGRNYDTATLPPDKKPAYVAFMKAQLKELVTQYDPEILWFDGDWRPWWTKKDGAEIAAYLHQLKPNIIVNDRVRRGRGVGDHLTPERKIPETGPSDHWESCLTMNCTWGYKSNDNSWQPSKDYVWSLANIASKGGNLLLNVGPTGKGVIPQPSVDRLNQMGAWLKVNGEAIYGTSRSPVPEKMNWGFITSKPGKLYLIVFQMPKEHVLHIPGLKLKTPPASGYFLDDNSKTPLVVEAGDGTKITLPEKVPFSMPKVVVLDVHQEP